LIAKANPIGHLQQRCIRCVESLATLKHLVDLGSSTSCSPDFPEVCRQNMLIVNKQALSTGSGYFARR